MLSTLNLDSITLFEFTIFSLNLHTEGLYHEETAICNMYALTCRIQIRPRLVRTYLNSKTFTITLTALFYFKFALYLSVTPSLKTGTSHPSCFHLDNRLYMCNDD